MTHWGAEDNGYDNQDPNNMNGPKALREAFDKQKAMNDELKAQLSAIQTDLRQQKVASVFSELGVPGAASLYQGEAEPEKIKEWATTMKSVFGGSGAPAPINPVDPPAAPVMDGELAKQFQQMQEAGAQGAPLGNAEAAFGRVNDASSTQDLINAWKTLG